jgi:hypothetical protein
MEQPNTIEFVDTMTIIENNYLFTPTPFTNGQAYNEAGQNNGSCKIFAFGLLHKLSKQQTLACFGSYYRDDVLNNPGGIDHQNIRQFMISNWNNIQFNGDALEKIT